MDAFYSLHRLVCPLETCPAKKNEIKITLFTKELRSFIINKIKEWKMIILNLLIYFKVF